MTTPDLAAALLRDVKRWRPEHPGVMVPDPNGVWVDHRHVLAALSAALDPAIAERAGELLPDLQISADDGDIDCKEAVSLITALLTANAALRAERDELAAEVKQADTMLVAEANASLERLARAEAAEAEVEKLQRDLNDTTAVAENYTNLVRCKGGRIRNAGNSGYVCFICGVDTSIGEKCRAALTTEERK